MAKVVIFFELQKSGFYPNKRVTQIQNGAAMTNSRILKAIEEVPVRS